MGCLPAQERRDTANYFGGAMFGYLSRFCVNKPPNLNPPAVPGGACVRRRAVRG